MTERKKHLTFKTNLDAESYLVDKLKALHPEPYTYQYSEFLQATGMRVSQLSRGCPNKLTRGFFSLISNGVITPSHVYPKTFSVDFRGYEVPRVVYTVQSIQKPVIEGNAERSNDLTDLKTLGTKSFSEVKKSYKPEEIVLNALNEYLAIKKAEMMAAVEGLPGQVETMKGERDYYKTLAESYHEKIKTMEAKAYIKF
jgi:hypothetical protein